MRFALSLAIAGSFVVLAITVLLAARSESGIGDRGSAGDLAAAYAFLREIQLEIVLVGFSTAAIFCALGWLLAARIAGPLMEIAEALQRIEQGERDIVIPGAEGSDELAMLARSMGSLVESLTRRQRDLERLAASLEQRVVERTAELSYANLRLAELSTTDALTGVANRRQFDAVLDREWRQAVRYRLPLSLIMVDIDHFKEYNDTYGHQQGDECLRRVAEALEHCVNRAGDFVARYGGEEFAVILSHTTLPAAITVAQKLRASVEALRIPHRASTTAAHVTISVGVATSVPERESGPSDLLAAADRALYAAKSAGRNRVVAAGADATALPALPPEEPNPARPERPAPGPGREIPVNPGTGPETAPA
ncbi:MAG TPA: diguanylate cyclase [bacterium]|nr:diguanylate cyclase [bacterium]